MMSRLPPAYGFRLTIYLGPSQHVSQVLRVLLCAVTVKGETVTGVGVHADKNIWIASSSDYTAGEAYGS